MMKKLYFAFAILIIAAMSLSACAPITPTEPPTPTPETVSAVIIINEPTITITTQMTGQEIQVGKKINITWETTGNVDEVSITLHNGGWELPIAVVAAKDPYRWTIKVDSGITLDDNFHIEIVASNDKNIKDATGYFEIIPADPLTSQQLYDSLNINQPGWESKVTVDDAIFNLTDEKGNTYVFKIPTSSLYGGIVLPQKATGVTIDDIYIFIEKNGTEEWQKMHAENACTSVRFMNDDDGILYWACGSVRIDPVPVNESTDQFGILLQKIRGKDHGGFTQVKTAATQCGFFPAGACYFTEIPAWAIKEESSPSK